MKLHQTKILSLLSTTTLLTLAQKPVHVTNVQSALQSVFNLIILVYHETPLYVVKSHQTTTFQSACKTAQLVLPLNHVHETNVQSIVQSVFNLTILFTVVQLYVVKFQNKITLSSACFIQKVCQLLLYHAQEESDVSTVQSVFNKTKLFLEPPLTVVNCHHTIYLPSLLSKINIGRLFKVGQTKVLSNVQSEFNLISTFDHVHTNIFQSLITLIHHIVPHHKLQGTNVVSKEKSLFNLQI